LFCTYPPIRAVEDEKLHKEDGKHAESMAALGKAKAILGLK
jgi:hypothetical protein